MMVREEMEGEGEGEIVDGGWFWIGDGGIGEGF